MKLGMQVDLGPGLNGLDGDPAPPKKGGTPSFLADVYCGQTVAHLSYCWQLFVIICVLWCIHRVKWRHSNLWSHYDHHSMGQHIVLCGGEDLSLYSNKIESVGSRKCPCNHYLTKKWCYSNNHFTELAPHNGGSWHRYDLKKLCHCVILRIVICFWSLILVVRNWYQTLALGGSVKDEVDWAIFNDCHQCLKFTSVIWHWVTGR